MFNFKSDDLPKESCKFFFIFSPNNSGTTIISQYLQAQLGGYLPPFGNNEGQMVPGARKLMRENPWDAESKFNWRKIRTIWERFAVGQTFIEASPPNMMRYKAIARIFGADSSAMANISSPYFQVASGLRRYFKPGAKVRPIARQWVEKARMIKSFCQDFPQFPLIRYEDFVKDPAVVNQKLALPLVEFTGSGKRGSEGSGVVDMSVRTSSFLTKEEIDEVSLVMERNGRICEEFGYPVLRGDDLISQLSAMNPSEYLIAQERRRSWETGQPALEGGQAGPSFRA